ncbi:RTC4-like domain-containing protein, partial [Helicostylum pulchrum]
PKLKLNLRKKNVKSINQEKQTILKSLDASKKQENDDKDKVKCPYCSEILFPMRPSILKALKKIELKDEKHREAEMKLIDIEDEFNMIKSRYISTEEKDEFCQLHYKELVVKPDGVDKGYPIKIDFDVIPQRISKFSKELEDIISKEIQSDYRKIAAEAYREQGITQARSAMSVLQRFHWTLPGYYGPKGSAIIIQALSDMYLKTGYLKKHLVSQQLPLEFIQQVLVPETGLRLIRQDLHKKSTTPPSDSTSKAKQIMIDSCDYGSIVFPMDQSNID